jgi:hypothetical protein
VVNPAAHRPDGTDADHFVMRPLGPGVTKAIMHRLGGLLALLSGRTHGRVFVSVLAYQPGRPNSNDQLQQHISTVLSEFWLTGTTAWPFPVSVARARIPTTSDQVDAIADPANLSEPYDVTTQVSDKKRTLGE